MERNGRRERKLDARSLKKLLTVGRAYGEWLELLRSPSKTEMEQNPEFEGLVFDEDEEEKQNPNGDIRVFLWECYAPAFEIWKLSRRFPDSNGNPTPSIIVDCLRERGLPIEENLECISLIQSGFLESTSHLKR